jgi:hypothetical protein
MSPVDVFTPWFQGKKQELYDRLKALLSEGHKDTESDAMDVDDSVPAVADATLSAQNESEKVPEDASSSSSPPPSSSPSSSSAAAQLYAPEPADDAYMASSEETASPTAAPTLETIPTNDVDGLERPLGHGEANNGGAEEAMVDKAYRNSAVVAAADSEVEMASEQLLSPITGESSREVVQGSQAPTNATEELLDKTTESGDQAVVSAKKGTVEWTGTDEAEGMEGSESSQSKEYTLKDQLLAMKRTRMLSESQQQVPAVLTKSVHVRIDNFLRPLNHKVICRCFAL